MKTVRHFVAVIALLAFAMPLLAGKSKDANKKPDYLAWGDSPEAYFMTSSEELDWLHVLTKEDADKFLAAYWAKRGGESFHQEILARIKAADQYFGLPDRKGSTTEKGRVFMILGAPNQQFESRNMQGTPQAPDQSLGNFGKNNTLEAQARTRTTWVYKKDRLPQELGAPEMTVIFQTDVSRGDQVVENPGLIEPYLHKYVDWKMNQLFASASKTAAAPSTPTQTKAAVNAAPAFDSALWSAADKLNGAIVTGDSYVSPTDKAFYALSFYLPKSSFADANDVVVAGSIKDAAGAEVTTVRQKVTAGPYDASGDRYADVGVELAPGKYDGEFAVYAADGTTLLANTKKTIEVAAPSQTRMSSVLMTSHIDTLEKQQAFDPFTFIATKYAVKGDRRFKKADKIGYFTVLANPTASPDPSVTMKMKVSRDGKVVDGGSWMPVDLSQTGPHTYLLATQFEPNSLAPGHYTLEVTVRDMKADKTSEAYTKGYSRSAEFEVVQ